LYHHSSRTVETVKTFVQDVDLVLKMFMELQIIGKIFQGIILYHVWWCCSAATIGKIVGSVIGGVIFLSVVIVVIVVMSYKRAQAEANKVKLTAQLYGVAETEMEVQWHRVQT